MINFYQAKMKKMSGDHDANLLPEENYPVEMVPASKDDNFSSLGAFADGPGIYPADRFLAAKELMEISWQAARERLHGLVMLFVSFWAALFLIILVWSLLAFFLKRPLLVLLCGIGMFVCFIAAYVLFGASYIILVGGNRDLSVRAAIGQAAARMISFFKALIMVLAVFVDILVPMLILGIVYAITAFCVPILVDDPLLADAFINVVNWFLGFLSLLLYLSLMPFFLLFATWSYFFFFALLVDGLSPMDAAGYSYGIMKKHKKGVLWRIVVFIVFYFLIIIPLTLLSERHWLFVFLQAVANLILSIWMSVYIYSMYENLKRIAKAGIDAADYGRMRNMIGLGEVLLLLAFIPYVSAVAVWMSAGMR